MWSRRKLTRKERQRLVGFLNNAFYRYVDYFKEVLFDPAKFNSDAYWQAHRAAGEILDLQDLVEEKRFP